MVVLEEATLILPPLPLPPVPWFARTGSELWPDQPCVVRQVRSTCRVPRLARPLSPRAGVAHRVLGRGRPRPSPTTEGASKVTSSQQMEWRALLDSNQWPSASETD